MIFSNWHHTHTDDIFRDGCWCTCNFSCTISWLFFTTLTASCYWFFAFWLVCMHSCWVISLAHIANFSLRAVSSTKVLTYWFIATKAKILLPAKLSSVSNFHLLCSKHQCHQFLASRTSWLHLLQVFLSIG